MIYGYARVSSNGQDLAQQLAQLDAAGCTKVYREKVSAATAERPQLRRAIGALDAGDVLMVTSTDRLARNTRDLLNILHAVKEAGAGFRSIAEPMVDTTSQFAEVVIAVLGIAASYERQRITERTAAGRGDCTKVTYLHAKSERTGNAGTLCSSPWLRGLCRGRFCRS